MVTATVAPRRRRRRIWSTAMLLYSLQCWTAIESFHAPVDIRKRINSLSPLHVHMFDPFQGASRYVVSSEHDAADDGTMSATAAKGGGATTTTATTSAYPSSGGGSSLSSNTESVYIGRDNETIATSHGLERNNLLRNEAMEPNLGSAFVGNSTINHGGLFGNTVVPSHGVSKDASATTANQQLRATAAPSMTDLYNRMSQLQRELKTRNEQFQGTVIKLANATGKVTTRLQSSSQNVHQIVSDLKLQAEAAQKDVRVKEETVNRVNGEFRQLQESTSQKIKVLAEQLQEYKLKAHATQVATQQKANDEQSQLRTKIQNLEEQLRHQQNITATEERKADDACRQRLVIEKKLESTKAALQANIRDLEGRLAQLKADKADEQRKFEKERQLELQQLRSELGKVVREASERQESLQNDIRLKESQFQKSMQELTEQSTSKERTMNEKVQHFANELQKVIKESQQRLVAEQDHAKQERQILLDQIHVKEEELKRESAQSAALDLKVREYSNNQRRLESELLLLRKEYDQSLSDWQKRRDELEESHQREREGLESKLAQAKEKAHQMAAKESEQVDKIRQMDEKLTKLNERSRLSLEEARYAAAQVQDDLKHQIKIAEKELAEQIHINSNLEEREKKYFVRLSDISGELSALKNKYARDLALWESRYQSLKEAHSFDRETANATIARLTVDSARQLAEVADEAKMERHSLEQDLQAKDSVILDLHKQLNKTMADMESCIQLVRNDLQRTKSEANATLALEKRKASEELNTLRLEIEKKGQHLSHQVRVNSDLETKNKKQMELRTQVEGELSALKNKYAREVALWDERMKSLQEETSKERKEQRRNLADKQTEIDTLIEEHAREIKRQKALLVDGLALKDSSNRLAIQQLEDSSARERSKLLDQIRFLNNTLEQVRTDTQHQLSREKDDSLARQNDLRLQIARKEEELRTQLRAVHQANTATEQARARQRSTQDEYLILKNKYSASKAQWESKHSALEEVRQKEQNDSRSELARKETEAQAKIDSTLAQLRAKEAEFARCMKTMDHDYRQKIGDLHQQYQNREKDLTVRIEAEKFKLQEAETKADNLLKQERQAFEVKQDELMKLNSDNQAALLHKSQAIEGFTLAEVQQKQLVQRLENELSAMKSEHASTIIQWTERCTALQDELNASEDAHHKERLAKDEETKRLLGEASAKADQIRANVKLAAKARDSLYEEKIARLQASLDTAERQLNSQIEQLRKSGDEARKKHADLLKQFKDKERDLDEQVAVTSEQLRESEKLRRSQTDLETALETLKKQHETTSSKWIAKLNILEDSAVEAQQANEIALACKEAEWKKQMDDAVAALVDEKRELEKSLMYKEKSLSRNLMALKETSALKESELKKRLQAVTDEYQKYKFSAHQALMEQAQRQAEFEAGEHSEDDMQAGTLERIRFDLSKLLIKKEIEVLRKNAELEPYSLPASTKANGFRQRKRSDNENARPLKHSKRKSFRERLAGIFSRSLNDASPTSIEGSTEKELLYRR